MNSPSHRRPPAPPRRRGLALASALLLAACRPAATPPPVDAGAPSDTPPPPPTPTATATATADTRQAIPTTGFGDETRPLKAADHYSDVVKPVECSGRGEDLLGCFVRIPGGTFLQGAQAADPAAPNHDPLAAEDEGPVRQVTIEPFFLQINEVSALQYSACVEAGKCRAEDLASGGGFLNSGVVARVDFPANGVTYRGASDYCRWIGGRLPTEAEWERAAREPASAIPGRKVPVSCDTAVVAKAGGKRCQWDATVEVFREPGTGELISGRIQHLLGNVWEWTADWYRPYAPGPVTNPTGPASGDRRVQRGASFTTDDPAQLRASARGAMDPEARLDDVGFRCALSKLP